MVRRNRRFSAAAVFNVMWVDACESTIRGQFSLKRDLVCLLPNACPALAKGRVYNQLSRFAVRLHVNAGDDAPPCRIGDNIVP